MKKTCIMKIIALALCVAGLLLLLPGAVADTEQELLERLRTVPDFKFQQHKNGIGTGKVAIYTAPSRSAYRCADGRASCELDDEDIGEAGYDHNWLLIRYKTSSGQIRVGYAHRDEVEDYKSTMPKMEGDMIPLTAALRIYITDGPVRNYIPFGVIEKGQTFYVLRKYTYTGSWYYVECSINGQLARGFIDRNEAAFYLGANVDPDSGAPVYYLDILGYPELSPRNTARIGHFQVNGGERKLVRKEPNGEQITVAYSDRFYPCYDVQDSGNGKAWYYIWVEEDSKWGWIHSSNGVLVPD